MEDKKLWLLATLFLTLAGAMWGIWITEKHNMVNPVSPSDHDIKLIEANGSILIQGKNLNIVDGVGKSMLPTQKEIGEAIGERNFTADQIKVGDIVTYQVNETVGIMHRVIWRNQTFFQAQGDNNPFPDPVKPISAISSIIVAIIY